MAPDRGTNVNGDEELGAVQPVGNLEGIPERVAAIEQLRPQKRTRIANRGVSPIHTIDRHDETTAFQQSLSSRPALDRATKIDLATLTIVRLGKSEVGKSAEQFF